MKLPTIDLASLPDLNAAIGMFGSTRTDNPGHNDTIAILATVVDESSPGGGII